MASLSELMGQTSPGHVTRESHRGPRVEVECGMEREGRLRQAGRERKQSESTLPFP